MQCVWAGFAKITLEVRQPSAPDATRVVVGTGGPTAANIPGDADLGPWHFSLASLEPRPSQRAPQPLSASVATVRIARR